MKVKKMYSIFLVVYGKEISNLIEIDCHIVKNMKNN